MIVIFKYFTEVLLCILVANRFELLNCKCTQSGVVREFQGKCYRFVDNAMWQTFASDDCYLQGGILAEIRNIDIHDFLIDAVSEIGFQWSWAYFAAYKNIGAGPWMWTYGDQIVFNKWAPGETYCFFCFDNCALIDFDARTWVVVNCLEYHVFICQYDAVTEQTDANLLSDVTLLRNTTKVTLLPDTRRNEMKITEQTVHGFSSEPSAESLLLVKTKTTAGIITTAGISIVGCVLGMFATFKLAMLALKYANTFSPTQETTNQQNEIDIIVDGRCDINIPEFQDTNTVRLYRSNVPPKCHITGFVLPKKKALNIVS